MRPLELKLRNFRSYFGDEAVFSFRDRSLVAIVGPIGSGKSSILDAIAFALYGRTPSVGRSTKSLIHQRAPEGAVALRFEVDGAIWEVVRSLRRGGAGQHALYRYASDVTDEEPVEKILQEAPVNERVAALLGLEFDAFSRSVLLAQGRFAEFLTATPRERNQVLKGLFGHARIDEMRAEARRRARATEIEVEKLAVRVEQFTELGEALELQRAQLAEAQTTLSDLESLTDDVTRLEGERDAAMARLDEAEAKQRMLAEVADRLPDAAGASVLLERSTAAQRHRTERSEHLAATEERLRSALEAQKSLEGELGRDAVEQAARLLDDLNSGRRRTEELEGRVRQLRNRDAKAVAAAEAAEANRIAGQNSARTLEAEVAAAEAALDAEEQRRHDAMHADMASQLRSGLVVGDPCPVCAQTVSVRPATTTAPGMTAADEAVAVATGALTVLRTAHAEAVASEQAAAVEAQAAARTHSQLATDLAAEEAALADVHARTGATATHLVGLLGEGDPAAALEEARKRLAEAQAVAADAGRAVEGARADHDDAIAAQQSIDSALGDLRVQLADAAARLDLSLDVGESAAELADAVAATRASWEDQGARLAEARAADEQRRTEVEDRLESLLRAAGVKGSFREAVAAATERAALLTDGVAAAEDRLAGAAAVRAEADVQRVRLETLTRLASDLTDAKFIRYLLDEERTELAEIGSEHFALLSSGRYRFTADGSFDIVDLTAADAVRKPESLSGGETFLASLGLALALAEMVARTGGRLDAFFLDEGFGTLDPEHLDLAMEGIEALVADGSGRLVVVVSHVAELRHRIDDLIVLDRDPMTGDSRVLSA